VPDDLQRILGTHAIGQPLVVQVLRGRELVAIEVHPSELPDAA